MKKDKYYAYRYFITEETQTNIINQIEGTKPKEELTKDVLDGLIGERAEFKIRGIAHILYVSKFEGFYAVKFVKVKQEQHYTPGETNTKIIEIDEARFITIFIAVKTQVMLIQHKIEAFPDTETASRRLETFFNEKIKGYGYVYKIYGLATKQKFWQYVESADKIYKLSLEMNAPNIFFGATSVRDSLRILREDTNNDTVSVQVKNKDGRLKVLKDKIGEYVDYIREVGGKYRLKFESGGMKKTIKSEVDDISQVVLTTKEFDDYSDAELSEIKEKLDSTHNLDTRTDQ